MKQYTEAERAALIEVASKIVNSEKLTMTDGSVIYPYATLAHSKDLHALAEIALASLETAPEAWAHRLVSKRSGTIHPWVYGSAEASPSEGDVFRIEVMKLYTAPPAPVVKLPSETVIHSEMDFIRKEKAKSRNETIAEVLRLNSQR